MKREMALLAALALLLLAACAHSEDADELAIARRNLRPAPCGSTPASPGVASVQGDPHQTSLGDWVLVSVCNMQTLMKQADAEQQPVTLFIEGIDSSNQPEGIDYDAGVITFILDRNDKNKDLWKPLLYNPLFDGSVTVRLSAGIRGEKPLPRTPGANATIVLQKVFFDWSTALWVALLLIIVVALLRWARNSDMLRDGPPIDGVRQPYSLARSQMAWWFLLIVVGYDLIWIITGDRDTIQPSLLGLMGISAVTAIAAAAIPSARARRASTGFWNDLVSDDNGAVALDRVQIVVWTVILGGIFLYSVVWDVSMPEFNATLLALMGISSGTYLGFKLPTKAEGVPHE